MTCWTPDRWNRQPAWKLPRRLRRPRRRRPSDRSTRPTGIRHPLHLSRRCRRSGRPPPQSRCAPSRSWPPATSSVTGPLPNGPTPTWTRAGTTRRCSAGSVRSWPEPTLPSATLRARFQWTTGTSASAAPSGFHPRWPTPSPAPATTAAPWHPTTRWTPVGPAWTPPSTTSGVSAWAPPAWPTPLRPPGPPGTSRVESGLPTSPTRTS